MVSLIDRQPARASCLSARSLFPPCLVHTFHVTRRRLLPQQIALFRHRSRAVTAKEVVIGALLLPVALLRMLCSLLCFFAFFGVAAVAKPLMTEENHTEFIRIACKTTVGKLFVPDRPCAAF